jgi:(p)ppGpp synthase/HD superfamily hydrolase
MPDPREEAVARALQFDSRLSYENTARAILAAADAVDPMRRRKSGSHRLTDPAELRARLADVEHDAATSAAAVARLYELLADAVVRAETAEAGRAIERTSVDQLLADVNTLTEALDKAYDEANNGTDDSHRRLVNIMQIINDARAALAAVKGREGQATFSRCGGVGRCLCDTDDSSRCFEGREDA